MTKLLRLHLLLALAALLLLATRGHTAGSIMHGPGIQSGSGIDIEIRSFYQELPARGFLPLKITISNNSGRPQTWDFAFVSKTSYGESGTLTHQASFAVANGEAKQFDALVPLVRTSYYGQFSAYVSGYGIVPGDRQASFLGNYSGRTTPQPPAIAMSEKLATPNWSKLKSSVPGLNGSPFGHSMLSSIPNDWRAFAGFDLVWLSDWDWLNTGPVERLALLDWVAVGGRLYVGREESDQTLLPGLRELTADEPIRRGFGTVQRWPRVGDDLDINAVRDEISRNTFSMHRQLEESYRRHSWSPLGSLPEVRLRKALFIGFLLLFAAIIGPANLFFFARGSRRYRLFWTTPVISLAASLAIFLLILFHDGVGGTGHQLAVWKHFPGENKAIILQEQASRTSLLTGREFAVEAPVSLSAINVESLASISSGTFQAGARSFGGDWFRNRSTQAHLLESVIATRWRIEATAPLTAGVAPELLSTFPFPLESVFYHDTQGDWWHTTGLEPGQTRPLRKVEKDLFEQEWRTFLSDAGAVIEQRVSKLPVQPGHFYAFSGNSQGTWQTLKSIEWQTSKSLHTGPIASPNP